MNPSNPGIKFPQLNSTYLDCYFSQAISLFCCFWHLRRGPNVNPVTPNNSTWAEVAQRPSRGKIKLPREALNKPEVTTPDRLKRRLVVRQLQRGPIRAGGWRPPWPDHRWRGRAEVGTQLPPASGRMDSPLAQVRCRRQGSTAMLPLFIID